MPPKGGDPKIGHNEYRPASDNPAELKLKAEFFRTDAERHIREVRQYLTWIEGEAQVEDWDQALKYWLHMQEPLRKLRECIHA